MKRFWLLCAMMLPAVVQAQFTFATNNGAITITGYTGSGGAVNIPGSTNGLPVTSIGTNAFAGCSSLNSVAIPGGVTNIESSAFADCSNLLSVFFQSNPPNADSTTFSSDNNAFAYCQPGATGWGSSFAGMPTVLLPYAYTVTGGGISVDGYAGPGGAVTVPSKIGGLPVTSIGANAFAYGSSLTRVAIPDNVANIEDGAFSSCANLASVTIGNSVTNIGQSAFQSCTSLTNVTFGSGLTVIGNYAFDFCTQLASITIPARVNYLGSYAFGDSSNLVGAYFQGNAPSIAGPAFSGDSYCVLYYLPGTSGWSQTSSSFPTELFNPPVPFHYTTNNGAITLTEYTGAGGMVTIPDTIYDAGASNFLPVVSIGANAFAGCSSLTSVSLPGGVTNIGSYAFSGCTNLTSVFFGSNAPSADATAFWDDSGASAYYLPGTAGWGSTFAGIPTVLLPYLYTAANGTITIRGYTGAGGVVAIPDTIGGLPVTSIGDEAFYDCDRLTGVTFPDSVTNIGHGAFAFCGNLTNVILPDHLASLGICGFWNCPHLASVTMGTNLATVGVSEFDSCASLTSVTIPDSVLNIGRCAFQNCGSLTNIVVGKHVARIGNSAFDLCGNLQAITVNPQNFNYGTVDGLLVNKSQNTLVQCPAGKVGSCPVPNTVTNIGNGAFHSCVQLTGITLPAGLKTIGDWAFDACSGLTNLSLPGSVVNIGSYAFESCDRLTTATIPDEVNYIPTHAFEDCSNLSQVIMGNSLYQIETGTFSGCPILTAIYFRGNAAGFTPDVFSNFTGTVYYLPGTTGWANFTTAGIQTALWRPQIQTSGASFGVQANQFGFDINWTGGQTVVVEACTNLANPIWAAVATNVLVSSQSYFGDSQWTNYPGRFYRLRSP